VPMQLPFSSRDTGYVAIIFLGSDGIEVSRFTLPFQPGERRIGAPVTNEKGRFEITLPAGVEPPAIARFDFAGNVRLRLSSRLSCGAGGHDTDESENMAGCAAR